eukprot:CAMPEP_0174236126 /NCGR_PEP_ID=MMETSP0417-20130205/5355_1 /TAXON_ID=242541 /ORGANISM="Mayorella sp, Strain BSH-02190019" /LENGTH=124 /DNA_ID=CAMNT_0015314723 /DNA_START=48 /DNA_END=419 /DNA_ORIENTATION=+
MSRFAPVLLLLVLLLGILPAISCSPLGDVPFVAGGVPFVAGPDQRALPWYYSCKLACLYPISWDNVTDVCRSDGSTMRNTFCTTSASKVACEILAHSPYFPAHPQEAVLQYPGKCGAPNYCYEW